MGHEALSSFNRNSMSKSITKSLQGIAGIDRAANPTVVAGAIPSIPVAVGAPHLGYVRMVYAEEMDVTVNVKGEDPGTSTDGIVAKFMRKTVEDAIKSASDDVGVAVS